MKQVEQVRHEMERRVSQEEFALDREAQADERNAREAGHAAAVRNVERVRRGILNKLAGEEQHLVSIACLAVSTCALHMSGRFFAIEDQNVLPSWHS